MKARNLELKVCSRKFRVESELIKAKKQMEHPKFWGRCNLEENPIFETPAENVRKVRTESEAARDF